MIQRTVLQESAMDYHFDEELKLRLFVEKRINRGTLHYSYWLMSS